MRRIRLGESTASRQPVEIPRDAFRTHFHLIGGTGKGKTTAIHTMLQPLIVDPFDPACFIIIDRLGNFSEELLLWMSSRFCTDDARRRLVHLEPAREDVVCPLNPLLYETPAHGYYRVERATDIILRAWESVNIEAMPRLARWVFNSFWAAAQLGLTISDCVHFLMPGSPFHQPLLQLLPSRLQAEWHEITSGRGQEAMRLLDSSRNRLRPYFDSDILRRMFGADQTRLDVGRLMREARVVIVNLAPKNRLSTQLADTIGALLINEVLAVARSLPRDLRYPTYLLLDEFQNFVGPDIEAALPEVRQLGLRLILSHQGFSQLKRGGYDLTNMIWQAQSRLIFGVQGEDADLLANELASLTFNPRLVKDEFWSRRQRVSGHRIESLKGASTSFGSSDSDGTSEGSSESRSRGESSRPYKSDSRVDNTSDSRSDQESRQRSHSSSRSTSESSHETLVPIHEEFSELSNRTYVSFDEQRSVWAREVRRLETGHALLRLVNDPALHRVKVKRSTPGYLTYDLQTLARRFPEAIERMERLMEENFRSDFFVPAATIDREIDERLLRVLQRKIIIPASATLHGAVDEDAAVGGSPFV